jgi:hypothetical protein
VVVPGGQIGIGLVLGTGWRWIGAAWIVWLAWGVGVGGARGAATTGPAGGIGLEVSSFELRGFGDRGLRFRGLQPGKRRRFRAPKQVSLQGQLALLLGWRGHGVRGLEVWGLIVRADQVVESSC